MAELNDAQTDSLMGINYSEEVSSVDDYSTRQKWLEGLMGPKRELEGVKQRYSQENPEGTGDIRDIGRWYQETQGQEIGDLIMGNMGWESSNKYGVTPDELNQLFDLEKVQYGQSHYKEGADTSKEFNEYNALRQDLLTRKY